MRVESGPSRLDHSHELRIVHQQRIPQARLLVLLVASGLADLRRSTQECIIGLDSAGSHLLCIGRILEGAAVKVPHRTGVQLVSAAIVIRIQRPRLRVFPVHRKLHDEPLVNKRRDINEFRICCKIAFLDCVLDGLDLCPDLRCIRVRKHIVLQLPGDSAARDALVVLILHDVELDQIAAILEAGTEAVSHQILIAIIDIQAFASNLDLLAKEVVAHVASVDDEFHALAGRIPYHALVNALRLPGLSRGLRRSETYQIAYHRAVQPVGQKTPALVGRHSQYRPLCGQLDCERLLRKLLCGIATEPYTAVCGSHIHASVSIVNGHPVVRDPFGILAADH